MAPRDPDQRRVLLASLADALGTGLFLPISVIYLTRIVGLSATRVGVGLTIAGVVAVLAAPSAGPLLDRFDARTIVLACFTVSALGFLAYLTVDSFPAFLAVAIVIQFAGRVERPATAVLALGIASSQDQAVALAWQQTVRNLGYGLGGMLAGLALLIPGRTPLTCCSPRTPPLTWRPACLSFGRPRSGRQRRSQAPDGNGLATGRLHVTGSIWVWRA